MTRQIRILSILPLMLVITIFQSGCVYRAIGWWWIHIEESNAEKQVRAYEKECKKRKMPKVPENYTGTWKWWWANGNVASEFNYVNGIKEGETREYWPGGSLESIVNYKNGKRDGLMKFYTGIPPKDQPHCICHYVDGSRNGEYIQYHSDGSVAKKGNYVDGRKEGEWISYFSDGKIFRVENFKKGRHHGKCIQYQGKDSLIHFSENYVNGKEHGEFLQYEDDGRLISRKFYNMGKRIREKEYKKLFGQENCNE